MSFSRRPKDILKTFVSARNNANSEYVGKLSPHVGIVNYESYLSQISEKLGTLIKRLSITKI